MHLDRGALATLQSPMLIWFTTPPLNMPSKKTAGNIIWSINRSNSKLPPKAWYYWYYPSLAFNPVTGEPAISYFQYDTACIKYAVGRSFLRSLGDIVIDMVAGLPRMIARWKRPQPPVPLPPERETFRIAVSADGNDGPQTGA